MRFTISLAFLLLASQNASAVRNAKTADAAEIQAAINEAVSLQAIMAYRVANTPEKQRDEKFKSGLVELSKERKAAYEKAIWLTIRAYDILPFRYGQPALPSAKTSLPSPERTQGKIITWIPVFEDRQMYRIQDEYGTHVMTLTIDDDANTASDGVSRIWPEAFLSPVELASTLIHEKIHFEQFTSPRPDGKTQGERELAGYRAQKRLLDNGPLVFTPDEARRHRAVVDQKLAYKADQVAREKAGLARGEKPLVASIVSHTAVEIDDLITQARLQVQIANQDHDERLQRQLAEAARRSCDDPGAVRQAELDGLPTAFGFLGNLAAPDLPAECVKVYNYLLDGGRDADELRRLSYRAEAPVAPAPVEARPYKPPLAAPPLNAVYPFSGAIRSLKGIAVAACATDAQLPLDENVTSPRHPYSFEPALDERIYREEAAGLDSCSAALFRRLFEVITRREGRIDAKWIHDSAAAYRAAAAPPPPVYYDPCRANGNKYCP